MFGFCVSPKSEGFSVIRIVWVLRIAVMRNRDLAPSSKALTSANADLPANASTYRGSQNPWKSQVFIQLLKDLGSNRGI